MKKILVTLLVIAMILGTVSTAFAATTATDVTGTKFEAAVNNLLGFGVLTGYTDGTFKPANQITRAEMAAVIVRALGLENVAKMAAGATAFKDVPASNWAAGYILVASNKGIIQGYQGNFRPTDSVTYAEVSAMLIRALGKDSEVTGTWPTNYVTKATELGLTTGTNFSALTPASRGDVALMTNVAVVDVKDANGKTLAMTNFGYNPVATITVTPGTAAIASGTTQQFTAKMVDAAGNEVTGANVVWSVVGGQGTISSTGLFAAAGSGATKVVATVGSIKGEANVTVSGTATKIVLAGSNASVSANGKSTSTITASLVDANGNVATNATGKVSFTINSVSFGTLSATTADVVNGIATVTFTATETVGTAQISAAAAGLTGATMSLTTVKPTAAKVAIMVTPAQLSADGKSVATIQLQLRDANDVAINNPGGTITVTLSDDNTAIGGSGVTGTQLQIANGAKVSGTTTFIVTTAIGTANITGTTTTAGIAVVPATVTTGITGEANKLAIQPITDTAANGISGMTVKVNVLDAAGNLITAATNNVTLAVTTGTATITSNLTTAAVGGVATFTVKSGTAGDVKFTATATNLTSATGTGKFTAGTAAILTMSASRPNIAADGVSKSTLTVTVRDVNGNKVATANNEITLARTSPTSAPFGTTLPAVLKANAVNGVATFEVTATGNARTDTFQATATGLSASNLVNVTTAITGIPAMVKVLPITGDKAGEEITVEVGVYDSTGNFLVTGANTGTVELSFDSASSATSNGSQPIVNGIATFTIKDLVAETTLVKATSTGLIADTTGKNVTVTPADADHIVLTASPATIAADGSTTTITAEMVDKYGNTVTTTESVTLGAISATYGAFTNSSIDTNGDTATLQSTTTNGTINVTGTNANGFAVTGLTITTYLAAAPARVVVDTPTSVAVTGSMTVKAKILDANGNLCTGKGTVANTLSSIGITITGATGGTTITDSGTADPTGFAGNGTTKGSVDVLNGVATFTVTSVKADTLTFTPVAMAGDATIYTSTLSPVAASGVFKAGGAAVLVVSASPTTINADGVATTVVTARIADAAGNPVTTASDTITFSGASTYLAWPTTTAIATTDGAAAIILTSKAGQIGSTVVTANSAAGHVADTETIITDTAPAAPTNAAITAGGGTVVTGYVNNTNTYVDISFTGEARQSTQTPKVYVNGIALADTAVFSDTALTLHAHNIVTGTNHVYIDKASLGIDGAKSVRVLLTSDIGSSTMSDAAPIFKDVVGPSIVSLKAATGATTGTITFSEAVHGGTATTSANIDAADLTYTDGGTAGDASSISFTAANDVTTLAVTFDAATIAADFTEDTLAAASASSIFDAAGNAMTTATVHPTH